MTTLLRAACVISVTLAGISAQDSRFDALAQRIATTQVSVKPGDVVMIYGGRHTLPLMESLAVEIQKVGGMPSLLVNSDRIARSFNVDVPEKYLDQQPKYLAEWLKQVDVYIGLPTVEDARAVIAGVPDSRFVKMNKAGQVVTDMLDQSHIRGVFISWPARADADNYKLDFATLEKMHWDAVNADYGQISDRGKTIQSRLRGAKSVRITSPAGTDLTFAVEDRTVFLDDGIVTPEKAKSDRLLERMVTLPGGQVFLAPIETSANGKVVVPRDQCRFAPLTGESVEFHNGKMNNYSAAQGGDCAKSAFTAAPDADQFSYFAIGLNPALKVIEDHGDYRPDHGAGVVTIGTGDNQIIGGKNKSHAGFGFTIVNATVVADGKTVVKDGALTY